MQLFPCQHCSHPLFFENTSCERCGSAVGFLGDRLLLSAIDEAGEVWKAAAPPHGEYRYCANHTYDVCNWLVPVDSPDALCAACELNETIPNLDDPEHRTAWRRLEHAKHRLVYSLLRFGLPLVSKHKAADVGIAFAFLADAPAPAGPGAVRTGHLQGTITINIAEADPAYRERTRERLREPYRTLIGHFRHEAGHYYWDRLIDTDARTRQSFRARFGDESIDYAGAMAAHYEQGPPADWQEGFVSAYASSHAWEDWAETWAHYFHLIDTLETANAFGLSLTPRFDTFPELKQNAIVDPYRHTDFDAIMAASIPLTLAVNSLNRSMGQPDLYPFVIPAPVLEKLRFIHQLIHQQPLADGQAKASDPL